MGLPPDADVNQVSEAGGRTWVATNRSIVEFDGSAWRRLPLPENVHALTSPRPTPGGELFAIGMTLRLGWWRSRLVEVLVVPLLLTLGILAVPVWIVRRHKRHQLSEHLRLQQAVAHATGAVPEEFARDERLLTKQSSWWSAIAAVSVLVVAWAGYSIVRIFWPKAPSWMFLVIALALHALMMLGQSLVKRTPKPWDPIEPGSPGFDWGPTRRALPGSLAVFFLMNIGAFPKWMGDPVLWVLYGIMAVTWHRTVENWLLIQAIKRGDYEGGLKVIRRFRFYNPDGAEALKRRGHLLLLAGRFREAEEVLRRAVAGLRSRNNQANALEYLGDALQEQGRPDEARRSYEAALHAAPGIRRPYRGMAELVLRQGRDPAQALEYVDRIVGQAGRSPIPSTISGQAKDDYWSLKAWALAEMGRGGEVAAAVAEAIRVTNPKSRPDMAATYRRLGLAMRALDRQAEADEYLKKARDADPKGRWSALASAALSERTVFRS
jgi:Flp pilus assembly protein TadD